MTDNSYEYIICGGGTVGCVLAARLSQAGRRVAVIEAGPEDYSELIMDPMGAPKLWGSTYEYPMQTIEQAGLDHQKMPIYAGKLVSGSSAVNFGMWTRGHSVDFDMWAETVGDERWSYEKMLPYFKKVEKHYDPDGNPELHGFDGPISTTAGACQYPLRETMAKALDGAGLPFNPESNGGNPLGYGWYAENWKDGRRQPAGKAYDLSKATVITNSVVAHVDVDESKTASGVTLTSGTKYTATREVIISCGALKTPQLLMLSGIGPEEHLSQLCIKTLVDLPVGHGYHDHPSATIFWKLKDPDKGLALGSTSFNNPEYFKGSPMEWLVTSSTPHEDLVRAVEADKANPDDHPLLKKEPRSNFEIMFCYGPIVSGGSSFQLPYDGTHISSPVVLLLPTSRGALTLASADPTADPILDPKYLQTNTDLATLRAGLRLALRIMETDAAKEVVDGETPPPGHAPLNSGSSDADLDRRIRAVGATYNQNAGTAAMGKVVDSQCRVKGVKKLRVCDASVLPVSLAAHYQAPMYALGEAMADAILADS